MMQEDRNIRENRMTGIWFLFSMKGRINRKPFWIFNFFIFIAGLIFGMVVEPTKEINKYQMVFMLWILWPSLAVQAKRWHDIDKSAIWLLINLIPIAGPIWALFENGFIRGTPGPNRFGPDPLEAGKDSHH